MAVPPEVFALIVAQAAEAMFVVDRNCGVTYQNPEAKRMFGFSDDEVIGRSILDSIHHRYPGGKPVLLEQCKVYRAAAYRETARDFVWQLYRKDGSSLFGSCTASPLVVDDEPIGALFIVTDITPRTTAEQNVARLAEKLQLATKAAEIGLFDYYPQTGELVWDARVREHFGLPPDAPVTRETFFAGLHPDDRERIRKAIEAACVSGSTGRFQYEYRTIGQVDGKERWIAAKGQVLFEGSLPVRQIGTTLDVTERRLTEKRMRDAAQHDPLTGLPNRALFFEYGEHVLAQAERSGSSSALMFIDLDRFKPINDLHGHETGDKVLQEIARRLLACTRKEDLAGRLGGDEFVVLLPRIHTADNPETVAQHILQEFERPIELGSLRLSVSASIGISLFQRHAPDLPTLMRLADLAMYSAKKAGRSGYCLYQPGMDERATDRLQLEKQLKHALAANSFALFYQPVIDVESGRLTGAEALLRLPVEDGAFLSPEHFIAVAESAGLIETIGHWVMKEACRQHQYWRSIGLPPLSIAINISPTQFEKHDFVDQLTNTIHESGMDPTCLQIELTEHAMMGNHSATVQRLTQIRSLGIRIALDDFGTGYSNLSHLTTFPIDKLKIDQSFIQNLDTDQASQSITDTILGLGHAMNLKVVGEGIESNEAMAYLRGRGCDQAQGYLFSKPLPAMEFESWYRQYNESGTEQGV